MPTDEERQTYLTSEVPHYPSDNLADWIRAEAEKTKEPWEDEMDRQLWERGQAREFKKKFPAERFREEKVFESATKWLKDKTKERLVAKNILDAAGVVDEFQTRLLAPWDQSQLIAKPEEKAANPAQPAEALAMSDTPSSITANASKRTLAVGDEILWEGAGRTVQAADDEAILLSAFDGTAAQWVARTAVEAALVYDDKAYRQEQEEKGQDGDFEADNVVQNKGVKNASVKKQAKGVEVPHDTLVDWLFEQADDVASLVEPTSVQRYLEAWGLKFSDKDILNIVTIVLQRQKQLSKMQDKSTPSLEEPQLEGEPIVEEEELPTEERSPAEAPRSLFKPPSKGPSNNTPEETL